jgi:hypothetical protein
MEAASAGLEPMLRFGFDEADENYARHNRVSVSPWAYAFFCPTFFFFLSRSDLSLGEGRDGADREGKGEVISHLKAPW